MMMTLLFGRDNHGMDARTRLENPALLTTARLAARPDFRLGNTLVSPSTRTVSGPGGEAAVEPRILQVLLALSDARGAVVTRDCLFNCCWGHAFVGDDSLNRAVSGVRRLAATIGEGGFAVETVPRTGYRLVVGPGPSGLGTTRRAVLAGACGTVLGGLSLWALLRARSDPPAPPCAPVADGSNP